MRFSNSPPSEKFASAWHDDRGLRRRTFALSLAVSIHVGALLLASLVYTERADSPPGVAISTFNVEQTGSSDAPEPDSPEPEEVPPQPPEAAEPTVEQQPQIVLPSENPEDLLIFAALDPTDFSASGAGCNLTGAIQRALRSDETVMEGLPVVPAERRSVANVLAVWSGSWIETDERFPPSMLEAIHATVADTVAAAPRQCGAAELAGPRLVYLPGKAETVILAFGSGRWTWDDVAAGSGQIIEGTTNSGDTGFALRLPEQFQNFRLNLSGLQEYAIPSPPTSARN